MIKTLLRLVGVLAILGLMVCAGVGLWWWLRPSPPAAEMEFLVRNRPDVIWYGSPDAVAYPDLGDADTYRATVAARIKSHALLQAALNNPALQKIDALVSADDPVAWIEDRLSVEFEDDSEVLHVRLAGQLDDAHDLVVIVDAIGDAFVDEAVSSERLDRIRVRDALRATYNELRESVREKYAELFRLQEDLGDAANTSADVALRKHELDSLVETFHELGIVVQQCDVNLQADPRVQRMGKAYIDEENEQL